MSMIRSRIVALLALALLPAGCANFYAISPGTPSARVEALVGAPAAVWKNPDGAEVWEYPLGPLGVETYMVTLGPDRAVRDIRQVLSDEYISKLHVGMSRDEVRRLLGKPREVRFYGLSEEEIWSWRYREWKVRNMELHVQFDRSTGTLKGVSRYQEDPGGGSKRP